MAGKYVDTSLGRRWQNADGSYAYVKPGGGAQFGAELLEFIAPGTNQRAGKYDMENKDLQGNRKIPSMMTPGQTYGDTSLSTQQQKDAIAAGILQIPSLMTPGQIYGDVSLSAQQKADKESAAARKRTSELKARQALIEKNKLQDTSSDLPPAAPVLPSPVSRDVIGSDGVSKGTQTSPGGKPIVMDMKAADTLYKTLGLGSYSSGGKGYTSTDSSDPVYGKSKNYTELKPSNPLYAEAFGQDLADSQLKRNTSAMSMSDALADTESMRGPETDEGRLMRARAAFLDTAGSYKGLRAQERELDIIYAGGQHYALGDDGAFIKNSAGRNQAADPEQVKQLKSGQLYKDAFKQNLINNTAATPSQAENPFVQSPVPVSFSTEPLVDFGSTDILGDNMDIIAGNAFKKSDISPLSEDAFTQDLDVSQYIPGYKREPYMRQLK